MYWYYFYDAPLSSFTEETNDQSPTAAAEAPTGAVPSTLGEMSLSPNSVFSADLLLTLIVIGTCALVGVCVHRWCRVASESDPLDGGYQRHKDIEAAGPNEDHQYS